MQHLHEAHVHDQHETTSSQRGGHEVSSKCLKYDLGDYKFGSISMEIGIRYALSSKGQSLNRCRRKLAQHNFLSALFTPNLRESLTKTWKRFGT